MMILVNSKESFFKNKLCKLSNIHDTEHPPSYWKIQMKKYALKESNFYPCIIEKLIVFILLSFIRKVFG